MPNLASAVPALRQFIPKDMLFRIGPRCRIAAIWALGLDFEKGSPPPWLAPELLDRLTDIEVRLPEDLGVKAMCAITLGRTKAKSAFGDLNASHPMQLTDSPLTNACAWRWNRSPARSNRFLKANGLIKRVGFSSPIGSDVSQRYWNRHVYHFR